MSAEQGSQDTPLVRLWEMIDFVRSELALVMQEIDSGASNIRNSVYRLAQVNITLADVVAELLGTDSSPEK
jgi:hypothetical protein